MSDKTTRILIVDDEPVTRSLLRDVLDDGGRELLMAGDAAEAMAHARRAGSIDILVVDKNLPDRSGLKLVAELKRMLPTAEAIIVTAYGSMESAIEAMRVGVYAYLTKPFNDITDVAAKVQEALAKQRIAAEQRLPAGGDERCRRALAAAGDAIVLVDEETRQVLHANPAAEKLYGPGALAGAATDGISLRRIARDGGERLVEVSSARVVVDGRAARIEIARDVTAEPVDVYALLDELSPLPAARGGWQVPARPAGPAVRALARRAHLAELLKQVTEAAPGRVTVGVGRSGDRVALTFTGAATDAEKLSSLRALAAQAGGELRMSPAASASTLLILLPSG